MALSFAIFSTLLLTGCGVLGSGEMAASQRQVHDFHRVSFSGMGTVNLHQGKEESLTIQADSNILPLIQTQVKDGTLFIQFHRGIHVWPVRSMSFDLNVKNLDELSITGAAKVRSPSLNTDHLDIEISGASDIAIDSLAAIKIAIESSGASTLSFSGTVENQKIDISGAGEYHGEKLQSQDTQIAISGGGEAVVWAKQSLDIRLSGAGKLRYYGNPKISQEVSGVGSVANLGIAPEGGK